MQVTNQKPVELSPVYDAVITGQFDPVEYLKQTVVRPLMNPLSPNAPVQFTANGTALDEDDLSQYVLNCLGAALDASAEAVAKELFHKTLVYFDKANDLSVQDLFAIQSGVKEQLPAPTAQVVYTPATDVIPACREFLAGICTYDKMFASLDFYARPQMLGFYFANAQEFDNFKAWLTTELQTLGAAFPQNTNKLFADFQALNLNGLTESLILRNDDGENNDPCSFARALVALLMKYAKQTSPALYGVLPFQLGELYCPKAIVFVNIERHSRATAKQVADEWQIINQSQQMNIKVVSANKLNKLTGTVRAMKKISSGAVSAAMQQGGGGVGRAARTKFRKTAPTQTDLVRIIKRVVKKMATVAKSENSYKSMKMSFARPNRRDPDNFNLMGKLVSTKYKPDIHIYLDTSGSISERNYQDAIKALIIMARKMNVNLYFNSFSHCLSQCSHLRTKDRSLKEVYAAFQKIPKVDGGTDYEQIWHYINASAKRRRELSIIMTDFEWTAPNKYVKHPKNLFYIPVSHVDWSGLTYWAEQFVKSMAHIDPNCRARLLF